MSHSGRRASRPVQSQPVSYTHLDVYKRQQVLGRIGAPGAPGFGAGQELGGGVGAVFEFFQGADQADVGGGEGVGFAQLAQGDVLGGPFADAADLAQAGDGGVQAVGGFEQVWVGQEMCIRDSFNSLSRLDIVRGADASAGGSGAISGMADLYTLDP